MPRKRGYGSSTQENGVYCPDYDPDLALQIEAFLATHYEPRRPPLVAARLLALLVELAKDPPMPFPPRQLVATRLACSKDGLDAAISVALERRLIKMSVETVKSFGIKSGRRVGVIRHRYYTPTAKLLSGIGRVSLVA